MSHRIQSAIQSAIQQCRKKMLISLVFSLIAFFIFIQTAMAARTDRVASLQFNNLMPYRDQYMTVIYALGVESFVSVDSSQIKLTKIKKISGPMQINNNVMTVPAVEVIKEGVSEAYNFIIVIVHPNPTFIWVNADRSVPSGVAQTGSSSTMTRIEAISKSEYLNLSSAQGEADPISINF